MGLCKCSKRKVTNQFCFEHRVNVCEFCMVNDHPRCVVQSYLQWLQDSDCDPRCQLCKCSLELQPCVRLVCYHLFHWSCLDEFARRLPSSTAPAGFKCPTCSHQLLPPANLVSAVADALRQQLGEAGWARAALAAPLSSSRDVSVVECDALTADHHTNTALENNSKQHFNDGAYSNSAGDVDTRVIDIGGTFHRDLASSTESRKFVEECQLLDSDSTENKYRRRTASEWLQRWFRMFSSSAARPRSLRVNRRLALVVILAVVVLVSLLRWLSGQSAVAIEDDSAFNPRFNPHVHVQE